MKPVSDSPGARALPAAMLAALLLTGCGQRGPLYLPTVPHPVQAKTTPIPTAPLPQTVPPEDKGGAPASR